MGGAIAGILPLLSAGFLFLWIFYRTRFIIATAEGQKLFFMSAATGFAIGLVAFPLYRALPESLTQGWYAAVYPAETGPLALALLLSVGLAWLLNLAYYSRFALATRSPRTRTWDHVYRTLARRHGTPLQKLLFDAADEQKLVLVTLTSRKVYCGYVLQLPPAFKVDDQYIEIIPKFSSARHKDDLTMLKRLDYPAVEYWECCLWRDKLRATLKIDQQFNQFTLEQRNALANELQSVDEKIQRFEAQDSEGYLGAFQISEWTKVIPMKLIESASIFDEQAHRQWFAQQPESAEDSRNA
ncbi:MAG: hypothetical protein MUE46_17890 [Xanthomonadales bacterium]|jgi:hypothetical protein|nr:hypothetical protein [Xanthomonadales bacterium]